MKIVTEPERYFIINKFEEGWGMEEFECEEQLYDYCVEALFIPEEKIEELNMDEQYNLEIILKDIEVEDISEDWYVELFKMSKIN